MDSLDYWKESISESAEECGVVLTQNQLECIAKTVKGSHECYGMAFYTPPDSDRLSDIKREYENKLKNIENEFNTYRENAEKAIKIALKQYYDTHVSIHEHGEVLRHNGRTERIQ